MFARFNRSALLRSSFFLALFLVFVRSYASRIILAADPEPAKQQAEPKELTKEQQKQSAEAEKLIANMFDLYGQGKYAEAIPIAQRILDIEKQVPGEKHPDYANSLNNLASLYKHMGDNAKAEPLYNSTVPIYWR